MMDFDDSCKLLRSLALAVLLVAGCNRSPRNGTSIPPPTKTVVEFTPLTQLPLKRTVHTAVDRLGNIFCSVETEQGQDSMSVIDPSGIPSPTRLTSGNILAALGESIGGNGTIQDIVADPGGGILFYFSGGRGRIVRACVGRFGLVNQAIQILFNTDQLTAASGMGESLALARGTFVPMGEQTLLLLRHTDAWGLFSFTVRPPQPDDPPRTLSRFLKAVRTEDEEINLTRPRYDLAPGPAGSLLLMDHEGGQLWQVDPATGHATTRLFLAGLPRDLSTPIVVKTDHLLFFAADSEPLLSDVTDIVKQKLPRISYPALVEAQGNDFTAIGRDDFRAPGGFPAYAIRISKLCPAPDGGFVAVDSSSGQLMRIKYVTVPIH